MIWVVLSINRWCCWWKMRSMRKRMKITWELKMKELNSVLIDGLFCWRQGASMVSEDKDVLKAVSRKVILEHQHQSCVSEPFKNIVAQVVVLFLLSSPTVEMVCWCVCVCSICLIDFGSAERTVLETDYVCLSVVHSVVEEEKWKSQLVKVS